MQRLYNDSLKFRENVKPLCTTVLTTVLIKIKRFNIKKAKDNILIVIINVLVR